jgi:hypothetical protein
MQQFWFIEFFVVFEFVVVVVVVFNVVRVMRTRL